MAAAPARTGRDPYVDFLRAFSLVVVVIWHWVFTILVITESKVAPLNPIGFLRGMWAMTWILQVMPVFFFVGGFAHRRAFDYYQPGTSRRFLARRMRRLLPPVLGLIAAWVAFGFALRTALDAEWVWPAVILVLSPLWFIIVYLVLVAVAPLAVRAHWKWGELTVVWLLGLAAVLDVLRFTHGQGWAAWINFLVIWGLAHQLGFFYDRFIEAPRRTGWTFLWGGLFALIALTNMGFYPRSMVGVPGERFSNMGPPTLAIVALTILQIGVVLLMRGYVVDRLATDRRWQRLSAWVNANSMGLYLFHTTGMALVVAALYLAFEYLPPAEPTLAWWLTRPVWVIGPAIATYPFLRLYRWATSRPVPVGIDRPTDGRRD